MEYNLPSHLQVLLKNINFEHERNMSKMGEKTEHTFLQ